MLSHKVLTRQDVGNVASYYGDGADDYYQKEGDATTWQGKGAERLGLTGDVDNQRFRELLSGKVSDGVYARSSTREDSKSRIGIDLTFSAPKSISLQALLGHDENIFKAHDRAVNRAVEMAENMAMARKKVNGKTEVEHTGNLIVAKFRHETSREKDPQLHTHAVILNLTQRSDGEWRALKNDEIVKATKYLGAAYRAELAKELQRMGYEIRHERDGMFELANYTREQLIQFSKRGQQVEKELEEKGLTRATASTSEKQLATMKTRSKKTSADREQLYQDWARRANEVGIRFDRPEQGKQIEINRELDQHARQESAKRALRYSINHLTERQAVMGHGEMIETALKHGMGTVTLDDLYKEIDHERSKGYLIREEVRYAPSEGRHVSSKTRQEWVKHLVYENGISELEAKKRVYQGVASGRLLPQEPRYTTQTALKREKIILQIEREGRTKAVPIMSVEEAVKVLQEKSLSKGQRQASEMILSTNNRIIGVQGLAGTGKTHMLLSTKEALESRGYQVRALAPYGSQVKALRESGIQANTLASFLRGKDKELGEKTILIIDEAGVVPTRVMEQTLQIAEKEGTRVVLLGDVKQTKAIESGRPFDQLLSQGMQHSTMEEIQRQKNPELKAAVEMAAQGRAIDSLSRIRDIVEIKDEKQRQREIAKRFSELSAKDRDATVIVTGTNTTRREINRRIRQKLGLEGQGVEVDTLTRRDTTQAERRFAKNYRPGDLVQPEKHYKRAGLERGNLYVIIENKGNQLAVRDRVTGQHIEFNPMICSKLSVYQREKTELTVGDVVRITRNDKILDLANGDRFTVANVEQDKVLLRNGEKEIEMATNKPLHLDHAYAMTVHSSQGLTVDRVFFDADHKSRTTTKDVHYVAISRARSEAVIFTNDRKKLPIAIQRENEKTAALDITREPKYQLHQSSNPTYQRNAERQRETYEKSAEREKTGLSMGK